MFMSSLRESNAVLHSEEKRDRFFLFRKPVCIQIRNQKDLDIAVLNAFPVVIVLKVRCSVKCSVNACERQSDSSPFVHIIPRTCIDLKDAGIIFNTESVVGNLVRLGNVDAHLYFSIGVGFGGTQTDCRFIHPRRNRLPMGVQRLISGQIHDGFAGDILPTRCFRIPADEVVSRPSRRREFAVLFSVDYCLACRRNRSPVGVKCDNIASPCIGKYCVDIDILRNPLKMQQLSRSDLFAVHGKALQCKAAVWGQAEVQVFARVECPL